MTRLALPNGWNPRPYQRPIWEYLSRGGKRAVAAWHRRAGKDDVLLNHVACAAHERVANYWYCLPAYAQARKAMWEAVSPHTGKRRIDQAFPADLRAGINEQEMRIKFKNGSSFQLIGSDSFDAVVGSTPAGIVFSEYALSNPAAWSFFRPILLENNGWATFVSTPRGKNHFRDLCTYAKKADGWFFELLTAHETGVFTEEQLADELREMQAQHGEVFGESIFRQEYECSFDAAILGSIWGDLVAKADREGRIGVVPFDPTAPVHTAWDLGFTDDTAIFFFQMVFGEVHVIDYYEASGKGISDKDPHNPGYVEILRAKAEIGKWTYGTHYLPHDARARTLAAGGKSIQQQLQAHRVGRIVIAPRLDIEEGIQAARATFPHVWMDEEKCADGIEHLRNYKREWDEEKKVFSMKPVHDKASHAASAFRTLSLVWKNPKQRPAETPVEERMMRSSVQNTTYGEVRKKLFDRKRRERSETMH